MINNKNKKRESVILISNLHEVIKNIGYNRKQGNKYLKRGEIYFTRPTAARVVKALKRGSCKSDLQKQIENLKFPNLIKSGRGGKFYLNIIVLRFTLCKQKVVVNY